MVTSNFLMSQGGFALAAAWLVQGHYRASLRKFIHNKFALLLAGLWILHIVGLLWTSDFAYAFHDIKIKLPLLLFPLLVSGLPPLTHRELRTVLHVFIGACLVAVALALVRYAGSFDPQTDDMRDIVYFISHIRLSLNLALASAILIHWFLLYHKPLRWLYLATALVFVWFINFIESATGGVCLIALLIFGLLRIIKLGPKPIYRWLAVTCLFFVVIGLSDFLISGWNQHFELSPEAILPMAKYSPAGNPYIEDTAHPIVENGHYIWRYIAPAELDSAWKRRSNYPLDSLSPAGVPLRSTLIRYMTSLGLHKDSVGVASLSKRDIRNVEEGISTIREMQLKGLKLRYDKILFELDVYRNDGDPSGNSLTQRFEFWRAASWIARKNPIIGVGTGDLPAAFTKAYKEINTRLDKEHRFRAHDQFFTFLITFGPVGLLFFLYLLFSPMGVKAMRRDWFVFAFILVAFLSFLWEDTLETQAGVTFFAFFYVILICNRKAWKPLISKHSSHP